ncbi:hypothetical protein DL96DRAFT_1728650 [Flagelloscypha sp. PMI_526]|nr:hypothetical protein DL96DRAFT_1728650 [Flagelloscypha sp. PMI_526]
MLLLHRRLGYFGRRCLSQQVQKPSSPFKILFLGRDEFSCLVLDELVASKGDVHSPFSILYQLTFLFFGEEGEGQYWINPHYDYVHEALKLPCSSYSSTTIRIQTLEGSPALGYLHRSHYQRNKNLLLNMSLLPASFSRIVPGSMLDQFPKDSRLNVHPSLLPLYRGPAPIQHTLLDGVLKNTGVGILSMLKAKEGIDCGDVWGIMSVDIDDDTTFHDLRDQLGTLGGKALVNVLQQKRDGTAQSLPQSVIEAGLREDGLQESPLPKAPAITIQHSYVDFPTMTAKKIRRIHNAISHQRPLTAIHASENRLIQLHSPTIGPDVPLENSQEVVPGDAFMTGDGLAIACARTSGDENTPSEQTFIIVKEVKMENKALMPVSDWWNGAKSMGWVNDKGITKFGRFEEFTNSDNQGGGGLFKDMMTWVAAGILWDAL